MKPIIGIVGRPEITERYSRESTMCFDDYRTAIVNNGGIPILILPTQNENYCRKMPREVPFMTEEEKADLMESLKLCDGFVLPGGNRIYDYDSVIADYVIENNIPTLGICMGMQTLVFRDFKDAESRIDVLKKIETGLNHKELDKKYVHKVRIEKDSKLYEIIGKEEIDVNSKHIYAVNKYKDVKITAYSEDGAIEGIEFPDKDFIIGVQWHPESMEEYDENMRKLFKAFIAKASKK